MKYFITLITILTLNLSFSQNQKITNYSLGRLFEKIKNTDYVDYKGNCQGYIDRVMFDYAVKFLDDSNMNNNTLKNQIRNEAIKDEYQRYIDKLTSNYDKNLDYYRSNSDDCPQNRYIFFKNHLIAYEMASKYFVEIYNNEIERQNFLNEYDKKYSLDSLNIVLNKKKENLERLNKIEIEHSNLETQGNFESKKEALDTNISSLNIALESVLAKLENEKTAQIKKLTPTNFKVNKAKIITEYNNKMNIARQKNENEKNSLTIQYKNSIEIEEAKYKPLFDKLETESNELKQFNYESIIPNRENIDDSKFREKRDLLKTKLKAEWVALFTHLGEIYKSEILQTNTEEK